MTTEELERQLLELAPKDRARLAQSLLQSLESLSDEENERLWADEAQRRDEAWDADPSSARPAADVFRDAQARLR